MPTDLALHLYNDEFLFRMIQALPSRRHQQSTTSRQKNKVYLQAISPTHHRHTH